MRIEAAGYSDRGVVRRENDDYFLLGRRFAQSECLTLDLALQDDEFRQYGLIAAVADGMGGYAGGEIASRTVLETLRDMYYCETRANVTARELTAMLERYLADTQQRLAETLTANPALHDAGTTLAGIALLPPDALVVFHIGDSRVLRAASGYVRALTVDHSLVGADLASGRLTEAQAAATGVTNQLTRALGLTGDNTVEVSTDHTWAPGDTFLLGTDGWHGVGRGVTRDTIRELVRTGLSPEPLVRAMLGRALAVDGKDNVTSVVVRVVDDE